MREAVIGQIGFFGASVLFGGILLAVYDVIRGIRRTWVHKSSWVAAEDLIFWLFVGIASFVFLCRYNQGQLRGFFFLGLLLGMAVYYWKGSRFVLGWMVRIFGWIRRITDRGAALVQKPVVRVRRNIKWKLKREKQYIKMIFKKGSKRGDFHEEKKKKNR